MEAYWPQIELARPEWLAALLALPLVIRLGRTNGEEGWSAARLWCRGLVVVTLVFALSGVQVVKPSTRKSVVFAVDQSRSITEQSRRAAEAFVDKALRTLADNRAAVLPFAAEPAGLQEVKSGIKDWGLGIGGKRSLSFPIPNPRSPIRSSPDPDGTNLEAAICAAAAGVPAGYVPEVVLLTDGNQTDGDALAIARHAQVPISTVPLAPGADPEVYIWAIENRGQVRLGERLAIEVTVHSNHDDQGVVRLSRGGVLEQELPTKVARGDNRVQFVLSGTDPTRLIGDAPSETFTVRIDGFRDTIAENNTAETAVFVSGKPRVMLVTSEPQNGQRLAAALRGESLAVEVRAPDKLPTSAVELAGYDLLILSNVPAAAVSAGKPVMDAIRTYVGDYGGGLVVIGGDRALTPGGYHQTTLEQILPVWCVAEKQPEKPSLAMVLVIDRSGSMQGEAIELAKQATRRAVRMLDPTDQLGVMAFEDNSHWVVPIGPCADKERVAAAIDAIVAGGGTDLYSALAKAYLALEEASAERKHIVVLTDGSSHPGDFEALAGQIAEAGITISTVAVGPEAVAELLEDVARIGRGHYYYCSDPGAVPEIFALETATASKLGIVERPFFPLATLDSHPSPRDSHLSPSDLRDAPSLLGYVLTKAKPDSRVLLTSDQGDPLLVGWRYGRGLSVVFTSDVESRWAAAWLRWPGFGRFWSRIARQTMRKDDAEGLFFKNFRVERHHHWAEVVLDVARLDGDYLNDAQVTLNVTRPDGGLVRPDVRQTAPGRYSAGFLAAEPGMYGIEIAVHRRGRPAYVERRALAAGYSDELRIRPTNEDLLRQIAEVSGGTYDPAAETVFAPSPKTVPRTTLLWPGLLAAAATLLVVEVAIRRRLPP